MKINSNLIIKIGKIEKFFIINDKNLEIIYLLDYITIIYIIIFFKNK